MSTQKLKSAAEQVLFGTHVFVLVLVLAENRLVIPDWLHVFGRLHPLVLHFPIAVLLIAVVVLAFPSLMRDKSDSRHYGNGLLLTGCLAASFTVIAGMLLSREPGYEADALHWHKWTGLAVFWGSSLLYVYLEKSPPALRNAGLAFITATLLVSGHLGASITHGEDFVTAPLAGSGEQIVDLEDAEVFAHVVMPILEKKCVSCHKASKQKGELRMDRPEFITTGGESGPAVVPGDRDNSLIFQRIHLPLEDEDHMPPKGKPQLTDEEKAILESWIDSGAEFERKLLAMPDTTSFFRLAVAKFSNVEKTYDFPKADAGKVRELTNFYRKVQALGMNSPALSVSYFGRAAFDPKSLAELAPVRQQTVSLNLNNMPIDDATMAELSNFPNLERLYLNFASIKGEGIGQLSGLENLRLLSLSGNPLEPTAAVELEKLKNLRQLFLWNTGLEPQVVDQIKAALPNTRVETGYKDDGTVYQLNPPVIKFDNAFFKEKLQVEIKHPIQGTSIFYTLDGTEPDSSNYSLYEGPLEISENLTLKARAFSPGWTGSNLSSAEFIQSDISPKSYELTYPPADRYKGDGVASLFDKAKAIPDSWNLNWLGFLNSPLEVEMEFEAPTDINSMSLSIWYNNGSRFFPPAEVEIWTKKGGGEWTLSKKHKPRQPTQEDKNALTQIEIPFSGQGIEQMRFIAQPIASLPAWHGAKGQKAWIMVDELVMN
ncbi:c-type cytochrome domain-containing protein [Lunatibacter salilacus]|uniref:c-type cytochrome domain-containing protein n=1 Tax=Lunatibacter salilacus TaxID=2483804 RepID=UPI00131C306D|nr:c-type cytochrome domain-containing protein [Lunatibacter salilacus]